MEFAHSSKVERLRAELLDYMEHHIYPSEARYARELDDASNPCAIPGVIEPLKKEARSRGLWNLFLANSDWGAGLTNLEYAPLCEILGRSPEIAPEATNCSAPDTGNSGILSAYGTSEHHERWLKPVLDGTMRSCFAMTEPAVASSDANNISTRIERRGDRFVINGRKWFASGALDPRCEFAVLMGVTDPDAPRHRKHSMVVVPMDTPGLVVERNLSLFGYAGRGGNGEISLTGVEIPVSNLLGEQGGGFAIAQERLGPGRIHLCMRMIGMAERALEMMCQRAHARFPFGKALAEQGVIQEWVAKSRIMIEQCRLMVLKTAWLMDTAGSQGAAVEIAAIKVAATEMASYVIDHAIQAHGAGGVSGVFPLAHMWTQVRANRIGDGPDEVHIRSIAWRELKQHQPR